MENQTCRIKPADRLASVSEYYFSKKLKEVAQMNAEGMDVISLGIGSPDMPPSEKTIRTLCEAACNPDALKELNLSGMIRTEAFKLRFFAYTMSQIRSYPDLCSHKNLIRSVFGECTTVDC